MLLKNQKKWKGTKRAQDIFFGYATALKINNRRFREDFESDAVIRAIMRDMKRAEALKLNSTPVFL